MTTPSSSGSLPFRPLIKDDRKITIVQDGSFSLLCCFCLSPCTNTTTAECLHRFCEECIERSLRINQKNCPTCRGHIPSRRSLRPDRAFDELIAALYESQDKKEKEFLEECVRNARYISQSLEQAHRQQLEMARREGPRRMAIPKPRPGVGSTKRAREEDEPPLSSEVESDSDDSIAAITTPQSNRAAMDVDGAPSAGVPQRDGRRKKVRADRQLHSFIRKIVKSDKSDSISFCLNRDPLERYFPPLIKRFIRTTRHMTVRQVQKYLSLKLNLPHSLPPGYLSAFHRWRAHQQQQQAATAAGAAQQPADGDGAPPLSSSLPALSASLSMLSAAANELDGSEPADPTTPSSGSGTVLLAAISDAVPAPNANGVANHVAANLHASASSSSSSSAPSSSASPLPTPAANGHCEFNGSSEVISELFPEMFVITLKAPNDSPDLILDEKMSLDEVERNHWHKDHDKRMGLVLFYSLRPMSELQT